MKKFFSVKNLALTFVFLFAALGIICLIIVRGWKEYRNEEFGFSFKYPKDWYISDEYNSKDQNGNMHAGFYVDQKAELPNPMDPTRSPGDVEIYIDGSRSIVETHRSQKDFTKLEKGKFGNQTGLVDEDVGRTTEDLGRLYVFTKQLYVETDNYDYYINSLTYSDNTSVLSQIKAKYYHIIGSLIINSFKFN